jgi:hypothetical protein
MSPHRRAARRWTSAATSGRLAAGPRDADRRAAFAHDNVTDTLAAVIERQPDWQTLPASTPPLIVRLLRRCLEKERRRSRTLAMALDIEDACRAGGNHPVRSRVSAGGAEEP